MKLVETENVTKVFTIIIIVPITIIVIILVITIIVIVKKIIILSQYKVVSPGHTGKYWTVVISMDRAIARSIQMTKGQYFPYGLEKPVSIWFITWPPNLHSQVKDIAFTSWSPCLF